MRSKCVCHSSSRMSTGDPTKLWTADVSRNPRAEELDTHRQPTGRARKAPIRRSPDWSGCTEERDH